MRELMFIPAAKRRGRGFFDDGGQTPGQGVLLLFLLGVVLGSAAGCFFVQPAEGGGLDAAVSGLVSGSFWESSYKALFYIGLALVFSTSYLGVFLIPALALVRAYTFACSVASLGAAFGRRGLACAAAALGIPALLSVPAFLLCACAGMDGAKRLCSLRFGTAFPGVHSGFRPWQTVFIAAAAGGVLLYDYFLLPMILSGA